MVDSKVCKVDSCLRGLHGQGYCNKHYSKYIRYPGDKLVIKRYYDYFLRDWRKEKNRLHKQRYYSRSDIKERNRVYYHIRNNFSSPEDIEFKICWGLENLQPLWWDENIKKSDSLVYYAT